jgi:OFA family oxalate/formate antiporter-like MFS transporter
MMVFMQALIMEASSLIPAGNRLGIALAGTLLQLGLGTVYAWSFFQKPLMAAGGWSNSAVAWAFCLAICFLGLSAAWGGTKLARFGPRKLALAGASLYPLGWLLGSLAIAWHSLPLLYIGFGIIGGIGLGLGYVTPVATAAKWFGDKKGLITGMVVMGFGLGALLMSKVVAPTIMKMTDGNLVQVFGIIAAVVALITLPAAAWLRNPPEAASQTSDPLPVAIAPIITSRSFLIIWLVFFCNITAGIMFIGFQSPLLQELLSRQNPTMAPQSLAEAGATLIGLSALCNGLGRIFWGWVCDHIGRVRAFQLILGTQIAAFGGLLMVSHPMLFSIGVCYVLLCYGGGFGTMPSLVLEHFGPKAMAVVYGLILTAWSAGGIVGPALAALIADQYPASAGRLTCATGAIVLSAGLLLALGLRERVYSPPEK